MILEKMAAEALEAPFFSYLQYNFYNLPSMKGWTYILECGDGSYYTGSTIDILRRFTQHKNGEGANHTKKHPPVKLVYFEEYPRIDYAFYREKQIQGWSRKKKEALISGKLEQLPEYAKAYRDLKDIK